MSWTAIRTYVIAEIGLNHGGMLHTARDLVEDAKEAGADAVKFQTFVTSKVLRSSDQNYSRIEHLCLSRLDTEALADHCRMLEIDFISTPGDVDSLKFLVEHLGVKQIKIGSDDLTNRPLLEVLSGLGREVLLSTGMANMEEITQAVGWLGGTDDLTLMHCVSLYPCPMEMANIAAIRELEQFGVPVGYSDHTNTDLACIAAVAAGAVVIERHFMGEDDDWAIDDLVSAEPDDFAQMVASIRQVEAILGSGIKEPGIDEAKMIPKLRKDPSDWLRGLKS